MCLCLPLRLVKQSRDGLHPQRFGFGFFSFVSNFMDKKLFACLFQTVLLFELQSTLAQRAAVHVLHCAYAHSLNGRFVVATWTDLTGELLETAVFPVGEIAVADRNDSNGYFIILTQAHFF